MRALHNYLAHLAKGMAWISGLLFLLLAFYMTIDAVSRYLGGPFTGVSDQIAAFSLSLGATWALAQGVVADKATFVLLTGGGLLFWSVMLSQALESVTRAYYARADLDLILSSPASARRLFAVRTLAIALSTMALSALLAAPLIDMLAIDGGIIAAG